MKRVFFLLCLFFLAGFAFDAPAAKPPMLFFYSNDCEHCAAIRQDFLPGFLKEYGSRFNFVELEVSTPANLDSLLAMESRAGIPEDRKDYPAVYFMGTLIEGEIPVGTQLAGIVRAWIANPDSFAALDRAFMARKADVFGLRPGGGAKTVHMAYFYKQGCRKCGRAEEIVRSIEKAWPNVRVESFDIAGAGNKRLAAALGLRSGMPRNRIMSTPVFFAGDGYVLAEDISPKRLAGLASTLSSTGTAPFWREMGEGELARADAFIRGTFDSITLAAVALAALGDGINPCAFATILFFVSYLTMLKRTRREILVVGLSFAFAVFVTYFLVGLGFLNMLKRAANIELLARLIFGGTGMLCLVFGILSVGDYFRARAGNVSGMALQLPAFLKRRIHSTIREQARTERLALGAVIAGFTVSVLEFACTGQVYLPAITYMASREASAVGYLLLYNALFILPLLVVFGVVYYGVSSQRIARIMERRVGAVKLVLAAVFFTVGGLLLWSLFS